MDSINPDRKVFQDLYQQEQLGEEGFLAYYKGDQKTGEKKMKEAMLASHRDLLTIKDNTLRDETKKLFDLLNETIKRYISNPNEYNLRLLKHNLDAYKGHVDTHQR